MFKMKYLINKMQCNILLLQMGDLGVRVSSFILKIKGLNLTNGVVNSDKLFK